ncbi:MAG: hypothetical protein RLY93_10570 [Sumerlaeia bacterium]
MSFGNFGTENLIFVPKDGVLTIWDVYHWRKVVVDIHRMHTRIRPVGYKLLRHEAESMARDHARNHRDEPGDPVQAVADFMDAIAEADSPLPDGPPQTAGFGPDGMMWWVRLSDVPAESFFEEDYEGAVDYDGTYLSSLCYGSVGLSMLHSSEIPLPAEGEKSAFLLMTPADGGVRVEPMSGREPLPLIHEYCGALGVSARGNSVNVDWKGQVVGEHLGCAPMRLIAPGVYATVYFFFPTEPRAKVSATLDSKRWQVFLEAMEDSGFAQVDEGPSHQIFEQRGYTIHAYRNLQGKETAGAVEIPRLVVVGTAPGGNDPKVRAEILEQILEVTRV